MQKLSASRSGRAKLNILFSLLGQFVTLVCGIIVPRMLIAAFGSEAYGATASIAQFLAYIALLEGGIGGVARAALYRPLAENDPQKIGEILNEIRRFFRTIAYIFAAYVLVLAIFFKPLSGTESLDWTTTFLLVIVISISTFAEYFIGISYSVLLQAAQKNYVTATINMGVKILNTIFVVVLVLAGCSLVSVKLVSSFIFALKPLFLWLYANKQFDLQKRPAVHTNYLKDKWAGLGQHIAYFLHSNTDIAVLTIFGNLKMVAVYSVYYMIVGQIQNVCSSFMNGMEAVFGDMLAKNETTSLSKAFDHYETLISVFSTVLFSVAAVMILPFVKLYTAGIHDANYREPVFAIVLVLASYIFSLRIPYHGTTIAAGHFKQTQVAAYGEAIINITLSIALVRKYGLVGVAIGTLAATTSRMLYYAVYLKRHIVHRRLSLFVKRELVNIGAFACICWLGSILVKHLEILHYFHWIGVSVIMTLIAAIITGTANTLFYRDEIRALVQKMKRGKRA